MNYELALDRLKNFEPEPNLKPQKPQKAPEPVTPRNVMPTVDELLPLCRWAVNRTSLDARRLAEWLIEQKDPDWCTRHCVRWWASYIHKRGWPQ